MRSSSYRKKYVAGTAADACQLVSSNWISYTGGTSPKFVSARIYIRNYADLFTSDLTERKWPLYEYETRGGSDTSANEWKGYICVGKLEAAVNINGFKLRVSGGYLDGGS